MAREIKHGTTHAYKQRMCRCEPCRAAYREANRRYRRRTRALVNVDREALSDLLNELFPLGLTDDCPARRQHAAA
jgi:hypothetical protein